MGALIVLAVVGFVLLLMRLAAPVLAPVMFSFYLAALALPFFQWLLRRGVARGIALIVLLVTLVVGGGALFVLVLAGVGHLQAGLQTYGEQLSSRFAGLQAALSQSGVTMPVTSGQASAAATAILGELLRAIANAASTALVSVVVVVFFLLESERLLKIVRSETAQQRPVLGQLPQLARTAVRYFGIRTRLNSLTGVGVTVICLLLGIDYPLLWGVLAFFLSYIPYIGLFTAMIPPTLLALAEFGWLQAAVVVVGITALNLTIENVLEPSYTGQRLQLSPTVVFLSFFFWAWLLGPVGAMLSMPITVLLMLVLQRDEGTRWIAQIIGREA